MIELRSNFFILTGASGSGKSSIIAALKARGQVCVEEIGRQVVRDQVRIGTDATPWQNPARFMELLLARSIQAYESVEERSLPVFFDRGLPETIGHARLLEPAAAAPFFQAAATHRYHRTVFFTPPWREIYVTDAERRHSFEEGVAGHRAELAAYVECGYTLVEVPKDSINARVDFILQRVREIRP